MANGGAGIRVIFPDGETMDCCAPTGKHCTNYRAETEALMQAVSTVHDADKQTHQIVFFSDALSVLQAYQNHTLPPLTEALQELACGRRVVLKGSRPTVESSGTSRLIDWQKRVPEKSNPATASATVR